MRNYSFKEQRATFYESLRCDGVIKFQFRHYKWFDQLGALGKIPLSVWDIIVFRLFFNVALPVVMTVGDFYFLIKYTAKALLPKEKVSYDRLFVCRERHLYLIAHRIGLLSKEDVWFCSPFDTYSLPYEAKFVTISNYAKIKDVFRSFLQSIIIHLYTIFHFGYDHYLLSLKAFDWCMMDLALRHIPDNTDLYYCNICDRVAVLIDNLPHKNKNLIQHGTMHFFSNPKSNPYLTWQEDKGFWIWNSLYKSSPTTVYCFTKDDEIALRRSVISNDPTFIHIGYDFKPAFKPNKFSILIIGMYSLYKFNEEMVIKELQSVDVNLYLKNHPSISNDKYNELRSRYKFLFIEGHDSKLPDVDIVISYNSTLALEYASIGAKVLYYGHFQISDIKSIVLNEMAENNKN